jgi:hypothetical protein
MKNSFITAVILLVSLNAYSQVGARTASPAASAALDVSSTTKGFLLTRLTCAQKNNITSPATELTICCSNFGISEKL